MRRFLLTTLFPEPKSLGEGRLVKPNIGDAEFLEGDQANESRVLASLINAHFESADADGILLSGMEEDHSRNGIRSYKPQHWVLRYL